MSQSTTKVSAKGQIVIPSEVQKQMDVRGGDALLLRTDGSFVVIEPAPCWVEQTRASLPRVHQHLVPDHLAAILVATDTIEALERVGRT